MHHTHPKTYVAIGLMALGGADLVLGNTSTPLPIVGNYLTQQLDFVLIAVGLVLFFV